MRCPRTPMRRAAAARLRHPWGPRVRRAQGGCYAKCAGLSAEKEPEIYGPVRFGDTEPEHLPSLSEPLH